MLEAIIVAIGILLDQITKWWISRDLYGKSITVIKGIIDFTYVENTGAAFGSFGKSTVFLAIFSFAMCALLIYVLMKYRKFFYKMTNISLAMVISGAVGNFIDRAFKGYVVDFIEFKFVNFAVFNVADTFITIGAIILCASIIFLEKDNKSLNFEQNKNK